MDADQREHLRRALDALNAAIDTRTPLLHYAVPVSAEQVERDERAYRERMLAEAVRVEHDRAD